MKGILPVPNLNSVVGVMAVSNHGNAVAWYTKLLGRGPDVEPAEGVAEWMISETAWIQVGTDASAAGNSSVIVGVNDIDRQAAALTAAGVEVGEVQDLEFIKLFEVLDPEGNKVNFVWTNPNFMPPTEGS